MKLCHNSMELEVSSKRKCIATPYSLEPSNDFLKQIEVLDSSRLTTSLLEILGSIEIVLRNSKGMIDIITYEGILTEFLKSVTYLVNRQMKTGKYELEMETENDGNRCNR